MAGRSRIRAIVIPNEKLTDKGLFYHSAIKGYHPFLFQIACKKYGVTITDNEYDSLVRAGFITIAMSDKNDLICYLPDELSDKQMETLRKFRKVFTHFDWMDFSSWDDTLHVYSKIGVPTAVTLDKFYEELEKHYNAGFKM